MSSDLTIFGASSASVTAEAAAREAADALLIPLTQRAATNGVATLDGAGKLPISQIPAIATGETYTVANQAAMLALAAQPGDIAIRSDLGERFLLAGSAATLGDWIQLTDNIAITALQGRTLALEADGGPAKLDRANALSEQMKLSGGAEGVAMDFMGNALGVSLLATDPGSPSRPSSVVTTAGVSDLVYDATTPLAPITQHLRISATAAGYGIMQFAGLMIARDDYGRLYVRLSASPGQTIRLLKWFWDGHSRGYVEILTNRKIAIRDQAEPNGTLVGTSTMALTAGTWYRLDVRRVRPTTDGGTDGTVTVGIFAGHATTALETLTSTAFNTGYRIDEIQAGSVNNSNLGAMVLDVGALALGARTAPGPYTGPASRALVLSNADLPAGYIEVVDGNTIFRASKIHFTDGSQSMLRPGDEIMRITARGNVIFGGPVRTPYANLVNPASLSSIGEFYDWATGRMGAQSFVATGHNDPADITLGRVGILNDDQSGTDASTSGATVTSATFAATSRWYGRKMTVGGTDCWVKAILSPTQITVTDADNIPAVLPTASGVTWSVPMGNNGRGHGTQGATGQIREQSVAYPWIRGSTGAGGAGANDAVTNGTTTATSATAAFTSADLGRHLVVFQAGVVKWAKINNVTDGATVVLDRTIPSGTAQQWSVVGGNLDETTTRSGINGATIGFDHGSRPILAVRASGSRNHAPLDLVMTVAREGVAYSDGTAPTASLAIRGEDGRVEILERLALGATTGAPTDAEFWRPSAGIAKTNALLDARTGGLATLDLATSGLTAGQIDAAYLAATGVTALNGIIISDSVAGLLLCRQAGAWVAHAGPTGPAGPPGTASTQAGVRRQVRGVLAETFDASECLAAFTPTTNIGIASLFAVLSGQAFAKVEMNTGVNGLVPPTLVKIAVLDVAGVLLAKTANLASDAQWLTAGWVQFDLLSTVTPTSDAGLYFLYFQSGSWGTTPQLSRRSANVPAVVLAPDGANAALARRAIGITDLPAVGATVALTAAGAGEYLWGGVKA